MTRKTNKPADKQQKPFDPWTATYKEALKESHTGNERALRQWQAAQDIENTRIRIEQGMNLHAKAMQLHKEGRCLSTKESNLVSATGFDILTCVRKALCHGLISPEWLSYAYNQRYDPVVNSGVNSWDDEKAFGKPYGERGQAKAAVATKQTMLHVLVSIDKVLQKNPGIKTAPNRTIDGAIDFFDALTDEVNRLNRNRGIREYEKSKIKGLYYKISKRFTTNPITKKTKNRHPPIQIKP